MLYGKQNVVHELPNHSLPFLPPSFSSELRNLPSRGDSGTSGNAKLRSISEDVVNCQRGIMKKASGFMVGHGIKILEARVRTQGIADHS